MSGGVTNDYIILGNDSPYPLVPESTHGGHSALKAGDLLSAYLTLFLAVDGPFLVQSHCSHA